MKVDFEVKCENIGIDIINYCMSSELFVLV